MRFTMGSDPIVLRGGSDELCSSCRDRRLARRRPPALYLSQAVRVRQCDLPSLWTDADANQRSRPGQVEERR